MLIFRCGDQIVIGLYSVVITTFCSFLMFVKGHSVAKVTEMGCCGCFGFCFARKPKRVGRPNLGLSNNCSQESLLYEEGEEEDGCSYNGDVTDTGNGDDGEYRSPVKRSEEILMYRAQNGLVCREIPVKETHKVIRDEVIGEYKIFLTLTANKVSVYSWKMEMFEPSFNLIDVKMMVTNPLHSMLPLQLSFHRAIDE